jgi:IS30 family transposase
MVAGKLQRQWSLEQVAGWLKRTYPDDRSRQVSHEIIYRSLFIQARGALKKELVAHLRRTRVMRRSRHPTQKTDDHGRITDTVSISQRPASVADRAVPGHWGGDLLFGSKNSQLATLVERHTRYAMLAKVTGKDTATVVNALIKHARKLPQELYKSLTWDRGKKMADHKRFTLARTSRSTSAIRRTRGSAGPTRTPMDYCDSTSPKEPTCPATRKRSSMQWPGN